MSGPSQIGSIIRKYPGYLQDTYSRADNFEVKCKLHFRKICKKIAAENELRFNNEM